MNDQMGNVGRSLASKTELSAISKPSGGSAPDVNNTATISSVNTAWIWAASCL
jgi:hypothetical protein